MTALMDALGVAAPRVVVVVPSVSRRVYQERHAASGGEFVREHPVLVHESILLPLELAEAAEDSEGLDCAQREQREAQDRADAQEDDAIVMPWNRLDFTVGPRGKGSPRGSSVDDIFESLGRRVVRAEAPAGVAVEVEVDFAPVAAAAAAVAVTRALATAVSYPISKAAPLIHACARCHW